MLRKKLKKCKGCGLNKVIWKEGKCVDCCKPSFTTLKQTKFSPKRKYPQLKKSRKTNTKNKDFFKALYEKYKDSAVSFESGVSISNLGTVNMAHIFPKEIYKSLAHNEDNIILLTWEEHTLFDRLLFSHEFEKLESEFKSWPKICQTIKNLLPLCQEEGKLKLALIKYLNHEKIISKSNRDSGTGP